jgi:hypothetical protein
MDEPMASVPAPHATLKSASRLRLFFEWLPFRFPFSLAWLASCPNRCLFFFLFQVVVTRGDMLDLYCLPTVRLTHKPPSRALRSQVFHSRRPASDFPSRLLWLCAETFAEKRQLPTRGPP